MAPTQQQNNKAAEQAAAQQRPRAREQIFRQPKKHKYKRGVAFLGFIVILLALTGLVSIVLVSVNAIRSMSDDSVLVEQFEDMLAPVVMFDPLPFASPEEAPQSVLIETSLWSILRTADTSRFQQDEYERMMIPQSDIDIECARLYGTTEGLEHGTFVSGYIEYEYDSTLDVYYVPIFGQTTYYVPRVDNIERWGNEYSLTVSYMTTAGAWGGASEPEKVMYITVLRENDQYHIKALLAEPPVSGGYVPGV